MFQCFNVFNSPANYSTLLDCQVAGINFGSVGYGQYHHGIREEPQGWTERWMDGGEREKGKHRALGFPVRKISMSVNEAESAHQALN